MKPYSGLSERQAAILRALQDAKARTGDTATSLHALKLGEVGEISELLDRGIVRRTGTERFYAPLGRNVFESTSVQRVLLGFAAASIVLAAIALILLVLGKHTLR